MIVHDNKNKYSKKADKQDNKPNMKQMTFTRATSGPAIASVDNFAENFTEGGDVLDHSNRALKFSRTKSTTHSKNLGTTGASCPRVSGACDNLLENPLKTIISLGI